MRNLLLSTVTLLVVPAVSVAAPEFNTHTHTTPIELRPISQLDKAYKTAGICFLGVGDCAPNAGFDNGGDGGENFDFDTGNQCLNEGFTKQNCNSVQTIDGVCPYNSAYGRGCKCVSNLIECPAGQVGVGESCDGKYASCKCDPNLKTCSAKENGQGASCGGKYESCVCKPEYQYTSSNCAYPQSLSGDECSGKYTNCVCPEGVDEGEFGCEEYYPSPCDSICKIAYSDNCHNRTDDTSVYGCMKSWEDCDTKCETPYPDNCHNTTAVIDTCPDNATCQYFDDCSKEVSSWTCNSGYKQEGNSCVMASETCRIGSIYYSDGTCLSPENHQSNKTVLGVVVYVTDGGLHGQVLSPWPINKDGQKSNTNVGIAWATGGQAKSDISYLTNYSGSRASSDYDSCGNTDILTTRASNIHAQVYPAAWAAKKYAPTSVTQGKWCLPAAGIVVNIYNNLTTIQNAIAKVGGVAWGADIWSSTEGSTDFKYSRAWASCPNEILCSYPGLYLYGKANSLYVRPVLEF